MGSPVFGQATEQTAHQQRPAQAAVSRGVFDSVRDGVIPAGQVCRHDARADYAGEKEEGAYAFGDEPPA